MMLLSNKTLKKFELISWQVDLVRVDLVAYSTEVRFKALI